MSLNSIIPSECIDDELSQLLHSLACRDDVVNILEIGSSSGEGSTKSLVDGCMSSSKADSKNLMCMELSKPRYSNLVSHYHEINFFHAYNVSSIRKDQFPSSDEISDFYLKYSTTLNANPLHVVLSWLIEDLLYIDKCRLNFNGIDLIKQCNHIDKFDLVFIDGSEFTGYAELNQLWGAKFIVLDDVNAYKNYLNYFRLKQHHSYQLIQENLGLRNGYAAFHRVF